MADQPVTKEKLINADKDVQVIEDFIKKPKDETVTTRFGDEIMTLKGLEDEVKKSGGYFKRYTSLAAANADIGNIPVDGVVKVTDAVDGGDYEKATASATSLTKSPYDPLTQAKNYTDEKALSGLHKVSGIFFSNAYYERDGNNLYMKLSSFNNSPTSGTFFVRAADIPDATIVEADAITQLSGYFGADKYPITSPNGVEGCFKLAQTDCITYDPVTNTLAGAYRPDLSRSRNTYIVVANNYTGVGRCVEEAAIHAQLLANELADIRKTQNWFSVCDIEYSGQTTYVSTMPAALKVDANGVVVYDATNRILYTPNSLRIFYDKSYRACPNAAIDVATLVDTTQRVKIYASKADGSFVAKSSTATLTKAEEENLVLFCFLHHSNNLITITSKFAYKVEKALYGADISMNQALIGPALHASEQTKSISYNSQTDVLTLPRDLLLRYQSTNYGLTESVNIDLKTAGTSQTRIFWDLLTNEFVVKAYNTGLTAIEKCRLVHLLDVRDRGYNNNTKDASKVELSVSVPYYVDGLLYGVVDTKQNKATEMHLDDTIKAINHRGYNTAPENTLPAYILSKKMGFTYVECDISFTKDDIPVLLHDDTIDRTSNGTGAIKDLNFDEVRMLDFGSWKSDQYAGTQIPSFVEFMQLCHRLSLHPYIEIKSSTALNSTLAQQLIDIVKQTGMQGKVSWISFSASQLNQIKLVDPKARLGLVGTASTNMLNSAVNLRTGENEVFVDCATGTNTTYALVQQAISLGLDYEVWTENNAANIVTLVDYGVSGISTDYVNVREILNNSYGV